jgi:tetratricopeptide (TPR) repeat protein
VANPNAADKYTEAGYALTSARDLLENSELHRLNHPLAAHVHERYAWILMNQWNVRRASAEFQEARSIRFDNFWKSKNDFAQIFVFHNDHGQAMAERYSGDARIARAQYDLVIGEIEKAMARVDAQHDRRGTQRFRRELRERYSNACERRADCELYQGAASGAPVDLQEAARLYALARDHADDAAVRATMCCKRAITLALDGRVDEAEQELQQGAAMCQMVIGIHEERVRLLRKLAEAVLALRRTGTDEGLAALRTFLKHFDLNPDYPDRQRRETQELQLLAAELLLATQLHDPQRSGAAEMDADYLDRLVAAFPYREQMLAYLRRYYDLLIGARDHSDPERAAGYILASRNQRPVPEATMVLFHFAADHGRVIVRSLGGQVDHFPLEFGRQYIKAANGIPSGTTGPREPGELVLPQRLVDLIRCEQQAGRRVVMFWDDSACWARAEAAITSTDWPFAPQLELIPAETVGPGREPGRKASDD